MPQVTNQELAKFLEYLDGTSGLLKGYDYLPDVFFFVKDRQSRLMTANSAYCNRIGIRNPDDLTGRLDDEFYPPSLAKFYVEDDQKVFSSGQPLENRLELYFDELGKLDWFCTTKLPLFDKNGKIVGLIGIIRRSGQVSEFGGSESIKSVISYIKKNLDEPLTLEELSEVARVSVRQLSRNIQDMFGESTHAFVLRMRVQAASEDLVSTDDSILDIALRCGFSDQSAFTKIFRKLMSLTPRQFRLRYRRH
jgi:AraC-like DNA-binding protein